MKIKIFGVRGEISETCQGIQKHSGILIDNILFDCGEKEYLQLKPKAIFLTHIHPDHWVKGIETDIPVYSIEKPPGAMNWNKLKKLQTITIDSLKITPIPTIHSKKAKSCAFLIENSKRILYSGDLIWINERYWDKLKNLDLVITEASSLDRDLVRRDKETGEIYGHSSLQRLVQLFKELDTKKIVTVHYGSWAVDDFKKAKEQIRELGAIPAEDGYSMELELKPEDVEAVTPKVFAEPQYGLIVVEPHGKMIWNGTKTAILKSRKFESHIGEPLYLIADKLCYGIITLKEPREINKEEFLKLYEKHRVSEEEREKWCKKEDEWCNFPLYYYEFDFEPFDKPKPVRLKTTGPQVFVSSDYIQFLEAKEMDLVELEYFHALAHSNHEEFGDSWCELHFEIVSEMLRRGLSHPYVSGPCDRVFDIQELIKEATKDWVNQYMKNLKKYTRAQVGDDFRIVLSWYSSIKRGKKLVKHTNVGDIPITEDDCKKLAVAIVKELIARGATFNRPETYKKYARELFEYVVKEIGEKNIPWKEETDLTLPKNLEVTDIDVPFVNKLSDKDLEELWKWLHEKWKKEHPNGETPEDFVNANIFIQTERWKRGLIDYDYEDKDALDKAARFSWQEYGGVTPLEEPEGEEIKLEDVIEAIRETGIIPVKGLPFAAYIIGRIVNEGKILKDHDIDILFRQHPDPRLVHCLKTSLPEWLSKRIHVVFDYAGPGIGLSIPVYGYALNPLPKELMIKGFGPYRELEGAKLGKYIIGIKPKSGWGKHEFWDAKEAWEKWGSHYIKDGIWVEEKVDGRRHQIHIMEDNTVKMFTEDTHRDRANVFPEIVKEFQSLHLQKSIIDGEILAFIPTGKVTPKNARAKRELWELMPREDTAATTAAKSLPEDYRKKLVLVIYDIMMYKGKDLTNTPYSERRKIYTSIIPKDLQYIDTVQGDLAKTMEQFFNLVKKYRSLNGSEGVVCKSAKLLYPVKFSGENRPDAMMKIKNLKEIDVKVIGVKQKKERITGRPIPTYIYQCAIALPKDKVKEWYPEDIYEENGKVYAFIGETYGTKVKCKVGDIVTVMPIRIRFYQKNGKTRVTWMFPLFKEKKPEKKEPDPLDVAEKIAKLGTRPAQLEELETIIKVYLKPCPFYPDWNVCPLRKRYGIRRAIQNLALVEEQVLKYPTMCPLARIFKCPYLKDYYYGFIGMKYHPELSEYFEMLDLNRYPKWLVHKLQGKYMEMPKGEHEFVMETHILTAKFVPKEKKIPETGSQHMDWRMAVDGYLVGWSIVGGSVEKMITPKRLLDNIGKGFRTEEKARQPCIAEDTLVIKNQTLCEAKELKVGDKVLTADGTFQPILQINRVFKPEQYLVQPQFGLPLQVDGEHPFLVNDVEWKEQSKLSKKQRQKLMNFRPVWKAASMLKSNDILLFPKLRIDSLHKIGSKEEGMLFGYYLGDGNIFLAGKRKKNGEYATKYCRLAFNSKNISLIKKYQQLLSNLNIKYWTKIRKDNVTELIFTVKKDMKFFSGPKEIPLEFLYSNQEFLEGLTEGLVDSDGYVDKQGNFHFINSNLSLINGLVLILHRLSIVPSIRYRENLNYSHTAKEGKIVELIWSTRKHRQFFDYGSYYGFKVKTIKRVEPKPLINIVTPNHTFCLPYCATHNTVWLFKDKPVAKDPDALKPGDSDPAIFDVVVGAGEPRGKMFVMTRGKVVFGVQKPYFHEYFLKDGKYFKDWTRIVIRGVRVQKVDPETKQPIKGQYETLWRTLVPKDQMPYALSKRAKEKKWKPPKDNKYPFPRDWAAKNFPEEFKAYEEYLKTLKLEVEELAKIRFSLAQHCYDVETQVLTDKGWRYFFELQPNDKVATLNGEFIEYQKPIEYFEHDYSGKMLSIESKHVSLLVTPNHYLYIKPRHSSEFLLKTAAEVSKMDRFSFKKNAKWIGEEPSTYTIPAYQTRFYQRSKNGKIFERVGRIYPERKIPTDLWCEFLGYYMSEGCSNGYRVQIGQSLNGKARNKIRECLNKLGFKFQEGTDRFTICNVQLAKHLLNFGKYAWEKSLPREMLELSPKLLKIFLDAFWLGDGTEDDNSKSIRTASPILADQIQEILIKIGAAGNILKVNGRLKYFSKNKKEYCIKNSYQIYFNTTQLTPEIRKGRSRMEWKNYSGKVYCVSVPNRIILIRRNGKAVWSGNSWKGPVHVRSMPIRQWYLFLDDKGKGSVRTFRLEGLPPFDVQVLAWNEGRDDRKYLEWQGKTKPMSRFNPNKELYGEMVILQKGTVDYSTTTEDKREIITLKFGQGQFLSGEWKLEQEEPESDAYSFYKVTKESLEKEYEFVYHKHCVQTKDNCHYDIRIKMDGYLDEFNLYGDIRELKPGEEVKARRKTCHEPEKWFLKEGTEVERPLGDTMTWVTVIDHGKAKIIENTQDFLNLVLNSRDFNNVNFIAKRTEQGWIFRREIPVRGLSTGDPLHGKPYSPFVVKKKSTWNYFRVYIYDPKEFTRAEPMEKVKEYLPDLKIPAGVKVYIGLYPVPGQIHHARVFMVEFPDSWKVEDAFEWIKKNKLPEFVSPMIREYKK